MLGFERGDIQMYPFVSAAHRPEARGGRPKGGADAKGYEGIGADQLAGLQHREEAALRPAVRKAIATSIDKNFITKVLMGGFAVVDDGPIVPGSPFAVADLVRYPTTSRRRPRCSTRPATRPVPTAAASS